MRPASCFPLLILVGGLAVGQAIPAEYDGEEITIGFNSNYLLDYYRLFQNGTAIKMELKDANSQIRMEPAEPTAAAPVSIIMPMRI